ncbi:MAG: hypothetical protein JNM22_21630 [Saprospiraceae bacterium]|nr:hypothetical protein [Saprospiraceae bacterium]
MKKAFDIRIVPILLLGVFIIYIMQGFNNSSLISRLDPDIKRMDVSIEI